MTTIKPFTEEESKKLFFISDTHFYHHNIIEFCKRPFGDSRTMDIALISNWNSVVPQDGVVFFGGDFAMTSNIQYITELVSQLNGTIFFVAGNHDYQNRFDRPVIKQLFHQFDDMYQFTVLDNTLKQKHVNFIITHYPFLYWRRGYMHLHGHVHSGPTETNSEKVPYHSMRYDIGVDNNNFTPISYEQLKVKLNKNEWT